MNVTLNITTNSVKLLSVEGNKVKKWGNTPLAPGLVKDGLILKPKEVGAAISALFKTTKASKQRVITTLTGLSYTHRILSLPRTKPALLLEAIQRSAKKEIPLPLEELYLTWQAINGKGDELDFFVLGVPRNLIEALIRTLKEAGVEPYIVELKPLALARAANRGDALIVNLEADYYDVVLVANGIPTVMHTITPRGEGANLEDNVRRLTDELSKTVKFYNSSHQENPLSPNTPLLLAGELAADANASELIQAEVEYPVEPLLPPLKFPSALTIAPYVTNMGLALRKAPKTITKGESNGFHDINLNILSGKYRVKVHPASTRYILFPLAMVVAIGLLVALFLLKGQAEAETKNLQAGLENVSQQLHQARLAFNEATLLEGTINEILEEVAVLKQEHQYILSQRGDYASTLELVTRLLPSPTTCKSVEINANEITIKGETDQPSRVIDYAEALENNTEFSEVRVAEIGEVEASEVTPISFTIVITK